MKTMSPYKNSSIMITVYNNKDIEERKLIIENALAMWKSRCEDYKKINGDQGTSVLGAGIAVHFLPPRCRNYQSKTIISVYDVTQCQGASVWESSKSEIIAFLKENGIESFYDAGNMD